MIEKQRSLEDGRAYILSLTPNSVEKLNALNANSNEQIFNLIQFLPKWKQACLVRDMTSIQNILDTKNRVNPEKIRIRHDIRSGDVGCIYAWLDL